MERVLTSVSIRGEHDVVLARQRARQVAELLGFDAQDQVRVATAVSEIARNVFRYAGRGKVDFTIIPGKHPRFEVRVVDQGPGIANLQAILDGRYVSQTGMGMGILGARRLMEEFRIESAPGKGTSVWLGKPLPPGERREVVKIAATIAEELARQAPQDPLSEMQRQNQELLSTLDEVNRQRLELAQLNRELEDTNRGVVALYAELDERADYLRRVSEVKTQFLSNMTHEFRTPLNSILSLSRLLLDRVDGPLAPEQERQVLYIQKGAQDLSGIVDDLLDLAKIESGKVAVRPDEFQVEDLFGALRGMLRPLIEHNTSISLLFETPKDLPFLRTDQSKVSQILRNLISNALKFTVAGEVRVYAQLESPHRILFSVADSGIGISLADQDRIFEEFTQVEGPHQVGKRGTGLGLPLSRKLAELLGGTLTVQSQLGEGSTFTLSIPTAYGGPAEGILLEKPPIAVDPKRLPVLVVEDNREAQFIYERFLHQGRFQPICVSTLAEARLALGQVRPVAILLDVLLEHESSWTFLADLKTREATRHIPVFVITMVENQSKAMSLGASAFCLKPINREWLLKQLDQFVPEPSLTALVADDDEATRYVVSGILAEQNVRSIEAADGGQALSMVREQQPNLLILDLKMPVLDGFQVLSRIRADPELRHLPVLVHTAKPLSEHQIKRIHKHGAGILTKNVADRNVLSGRIRDFIHAAASVKPASLASPDHE